MPDVGFYTLPVILSFQGIDKQVNDALGVFSPLGVMQSDPTGLWPLCVQPPWWGLAVTEGPISGR